jgi:hypothetical protein
MERRSEREALYDALDPFSSEFLQRDRRNFHIARTDVLRVRFVQRQSMWTPLNVGKLQVEGLDGSVHQFILVNDQDSEEVVALLKAFSPEVEIVGRPRWWQCSVCRSQSQGQPVTEFVSRKRRYRIDMDGLWECNTNGDVLNVIAWADLRSADNHVARSASGSVIRLQLAYLWRRVFWSEFTSSWRARSPNSWRENQKRLLCGLRRWFQIWLPLLFLAPVGLLYLAYWVMGCPAQFDLETAHRATLLGGGLAVVCWLSDMFYWRRQKQPPLTAI